MVVAGGQHGSVRGTGANVPDFTHLVKEDVLIDNVVFVIKIYDVDLQTIQRTSGRHLMKQRQRTERIFNIFTSCYCCCTNSTRVRTSISLCSSREASMKSLESVSRWQLYDPAPSITSPKKRDSELSPSASVRPRLGSGPVLQGHANRPGAAGARCEAAGEGPGRPGSAHCVVGMTCHTVRWEGVRQDCELAHAEAL